MIESSPTLTAVQAPTRRWVLALVYGIAALLTLVLTYVTRAGSLTDWDSWEYAAQAIRTEVSGLCLGRWWFAFLMHQSWRVGQALGVPLEYASTPMRIAVAGMTTIGVVALMHWVYLMTARLRAAVLAGAMVIFSGSLMAYSSAVMTEGPTLMFLALAFLAWEGSVRQSAGRPRRAEIWAICAGAAFGIAANMREPALMLCVWPAVSCLLDRPHRRWRLLALAILGALLTVGIGLMMTYIQRGNLYTLIVGYNEYMANERKMVGFNGTANVKFLLLHLHVAAPLASVGLLMTLALLPAIILRFMKRPHGQAGQGVIRKGPAIRLAAMTACTLPYVLMTWYNPDLSFNYRLTLPLAWLIVPAVAACVDAAIAAITPKTSSAIKWVVCGAMLSLFAAVGLFATAASMHILLSYHLGDANYKARLLDSLKRMENNSSIVGGPGAPVASHLMHLGYKPDFNVMFPGFEATPDNMTSRLADELAKGRHVYVNTSGAAWYVPGAANREFNATQAALKRFVTRPAPRPFVELVRLKQPAKATTRTK